MFLVNGASATSIDIADRGLQYGDGIFETLAVINCTPLFLDLHIARLNNGCERLGIPTPNRDTLIDEIAYLCQQIPSQFSHRNGVIKIIITRGTGGRGYRQPETITTTRIISLHPYPNYPENFNQQGIRTRFCQHHLGLNPTLAGMKHLNRLEQVLARAEWQDNTIQEGIMLDLNGHVIEGTMSNLFYVKDNTFYTACLTYSGIAGIIRQCLINYAQQLGVMVIEKFFTPHELLAADEILVCNSIIGIWPVVDIEGQAFGIGPITRQLQTALAKQIQETSHAG
ncbi:aminodeoxychorismate lyase [Methylosoma difficile]